MLTNTRIRKALAICSILILSGCQASRTADSALASLRGEPELPAEEQALLNDSENIVQRSVFQGAAIGAAIGCGLGLLFADNKLAGCAIGAGVGAVGGGVAGAAVGQGNAQASKKIADEDEKIAELKAERSRLNTLSVKLDHQISKQNAELASLKRQLANKQIKQSTYQARYDSVKKFRKDFVANLDDELAQSRKSLADIREAEKNGKDVSRIEPTLERNVALIAELRDSVDLLS